MSPEKAECEHWYAYRVYHQKTRALKNQLEKDSTTFFIPMRFIQEENEEGHTYREEPILPSLIFIRSTEAYLQNLRLRFSSHLSVYTVPGTVLPAVIPDKEMEIFQDVLSKGCRQLEVVDEKLVKGSRVRITGGLFQGSEGYIMRVHGTKRFVVMIDGVAAVATTFIPKEFIEKLV